MELELELEWGCGVIEFPGGDMSAESATKLARAQVQSLREQLQKKRLGLRDTDGGSLFTFLYPLGFWVGMNGVEVWE